MTILFVLMGAIGGFGIAWYVNGRLPTPAPKPPKFPKHLAVIYTGQGTPLLKAAKYVDGMLEVDGASYLAEQYQQVATPISLPVTIYFLALEPVALGQHQALEHMRKKLVWSSLTKNGGDLMQTIQLAAGSAVIGAAIYIYMVVSSLNNIILLQGSKIEQLNTTISKMLLITGGK